MIEKSSVKGLQVLWSVTSAMTGFAITTDGRLTWNPIAQTSGDVTVTVSDLRGGTATQTFLLGAYSDASENIKGVRRL